MSAKPVPQSAVPLASGRELLGRVARPADVADMSPEELAALAQELRRVIIEQCSATGGHLAPSLGVVEIDR